MRWIRFLNKELPLRIQFWVFLVAWFAWPLALCLVILHAWEHERTRTSFAHPFLVLGTVLLWLPSILTYGGILFLTRQGPKYNRTRGVYWWLIAGLTVVSGVVAFLGLFPVLLMGLAPQVRE